MEALRNSINNFLELPARSFRLWYMRILSIITLGGGVIHWARIVGYTPWRGSYFIDMPSEWQAATVYFGVLNMVAAIGLWLGVSWGGVMWLFVALSQIVMHSAFSETFGRRPYEITFYVCMMAIYFGLVYWTDRQERIRVK